MRRYVVAARLQLLKAQLSMFGAPTPAQKKKAKARRKPKKKEAPPTRAPEKPATTLQPEKPPPQPPLTGRSVFRMRAEELRAHQEKVGPNHADHGVVQTELNRRAAKRAEKHKRREGAGQRYKVKRHLRRTKTGVAQVTEGERTAKGHQVVEPEPEQPAVTPAAVEPTPAPEPAPEPTPEPAPEAQGSKLSEDDIGRKKTAAAYLDLHGDMAEKRGDKDAAAEFRDKAKKKRGEVDPESAAETSEGAAETSEGPKSEEEHLSEIERLLLIHAASMGSTGQVADDGREALRRASGLWAALSGGDGEYLPGYMPDKRGRRPKMSVGPAMVGMRYELELKAAEAKKPKPATGSAALAPAVTPDGQLAPAPKKSPKRSRTPAKAGDHVDVGVYVPGDRKDEWRAKTRINEANIGELESRGAKTARKHALKKNVFEKFSAEEERDSGATPGAAWLKKKLLAAVAVGPKDGADYRRDYVAGATWLQKELAACDTMEKVISFVRDWKLMASGHMVEEKTLSAQELWAEVKEHKGAPSGGGYTQINLNTRAELKQLQALKAERTKAVPDWDEVKRLNVKIDALDRREQISFGMLKAAGYSSEVVRGGGGYRLTKPIPKSENVWYRYMDALSGEAGFDRRGRRSARRLASVINGADHRARTERTANSAFWEKDRYHARKIEKEDDWSSMLDSKKKTRRKGTKWTRATTENRRVGGPKVDVSNPSGEKLTDLFGLRAVRWGDWVDQASRDEHLARSHEALTDLADVLGMHPRQISHGGVLAITIGARGGKQGGAAAAHYEPDTQVINLTHTKGAGSLAHEWAHFFDHQLVDDPSAMTPGRPGQKASAPFVSARSSADKLHPDVSRAFREVMHRITTPTPERQAELRKERAAADTDLNAERQRLRLVRSKAARLKGKERSAASDAYNEEVKTFNAKIKALPTANKTTYLQHAEALGKGYWATPHEMFARAFESYVEDTLHKQKRQSTYLVYGTRMKDPTRTEQPYPQDAERAHIHEAVGDLVKAMQRTDVLAKALRAAARRRRPRLVVKRRAS